MRLKSNIASLGSTLSKILLIDGKSYTMKKNGQQKIGVLAQDVQKVFPELVTRGANKILAVNYQGLIPVLINAVNEQQKELKTIKKEFSNKKKYVNYRFNKLTKIQKS
jgi:flagellar biosynthesis chaperone FliJ